MRALFACPQSSPNVRQSLNAALGVTAVPTEIPGSCLCGRVAFKLSGEPILMGNCHGSRCRKAAGGPFLTVIVFRKSDFEWTSGEELVSTFQAEAPYDLKRSFCSNCGAYLGEPFCEGEHVVLVRKLSLQEQWDFMSGPRHSGAVNRTLHYAGLVPLIWGAVSGRGWLVIVGLVLPALGHGYDKYFRFDATMRDYANQVVWLQLVSTGIGLVPVYLLYLALHP